MGLHAHHPKDCTWKTGCDCKHGQKPLNNLPLTTLPSMAEAMSNGSIQMMEDRQPKITEDDRLVVALAEARQYRESASHHRQIAEHYRKVALVLIAWADRDGDSLSGPMRFAVGQSRKDLDNPPEWDGTLIA